MLAPIPFLGAALLAGTSASVAPPAAAQTGATLRALRNVPAPVLDPGHAALVIIDAQGEYRRGPLQLDGLDAAVAEIVLLRDWAVSRGVPVIHIRQVSPAGSPVFADGSPGAEILPELTPHPGEPIIEKRLPNAFAGTGLEAELARRGVRQLILVGFMAHMCLDATTRAAFDSGREAFVVASATAERAIRGPNGEAVTAADMLRISLAALADRFAIVLPDAAAVTGR